MSKFDYTPCYSPDRKSLRYLKAKNVAFVQFAATLIDLIDYSTDRNSPQFLSNNLIDEQTIPYVVRNQSSIAAELCKWVKPSGENTNQLFVYLYNMISLFDTSETEHDASFDSFSSFIYDVYQRFLTVYGPVEQWALRP